MQQKKPFNIPQCPECGSTNIMTNKNGERFCRRCGNQWLKDKPSSAE